MLAEPNLLAINGKQASFLAGGEFPFPMVQPGGNGNAITLDVARVRRAAQLPAQVTPRGTIRLQVAPEVSSLDYTQRGHRAGPHRPGSLGRAACRPKSNWKAARAS